METEVASSTSDRRRNRAGVSARLGRETAAASWRVQVLSALARLAVIAVAVLICDAVVPGFQADLPEGPIIFAVVLGAVALVMQPVMVGGAVLLGWLGVLLLAFVGQASWSCWSALPCCRTSPSTTSGRPARGDRRGAGRAPLRAGSAPPARRRCWSERLVASARRHPADVAGPGRRRRRVRAARRGPLPGAADGDHRRHGADADPVGPRRARTRLREWTPKLPATTPASQMGILHGVIDGIPAFRWYDRAHDRVMVANKPADAAVIEASPDDRQGPARRRRGASISNLFTGDAPDGGADDEPARAGRGDHPAAPSPTS